MTESGLKVSHVVTRTIATITLANLGMMVVCERYSPTHCRAFANSSLDKIVTFWTITTALLLPLYVGFEGWWMRKCKVTTIALWIDAGLAIACFLMFVGVVLYAFGHYAMF